MPEENSIGNANNGGAGRIKPQVAEAAERLGADIDRCLRDWVRGLPQGENVAEYLDAMHSMLLAKYLGVIPVLFRSHDGSPMSPLDAVRLTIKRLVHLQSALSRAADAATPDLGIDLGVDTNIDTGTGVETNTNTKPF